MYAHTNSITHRLSHTNTYFHMFISHGLFIHQKRYCKAAQKADAAAGNGVCGDVAGDLGETHSTPTTSRKGKKEVGAEDTKEEEERKKKGEKRAGIWKRDASGQRKWISSAAVEDDGAAFSAVAVVIAPDNDEDPDQMCELDSVLSGSVVLTRI